MKNNITGIRGKSILQPGFVYAPYVPLIINPSVTITPSQGTIAGWTFDPLVNEADLSFEELIELKMKRIGY